jgi:hypothetical protein
MTRNVPNKERQKLSAEIAFLETLDTPRFRRGSSNALALSMRKPVCLKMYGDSQTDMPKSRTENFYRFARSAGPNGILRVHSDA